MENKTFSTRRIALIGVLSALVFAATYLHIDIPTALGKTIRAALKKSNLLPAQP